MELHVEFQMESPAALGRLVFHLPSAVLSARQTATAFAQPLESVLSDIATGRLPARRQGKSYFVTARDAARIYALPGVATNHVNINLEAL